MVGAQKALCADVPVRSTRSWVSCELREPRSIARAKEPSMRQSHGSWAEGQEVLAGECMRKRHRRFAAQEEKAELTCSNSVEMCEVYVTFYRPNKKATRRNYCGQVGRSNKHQPRALEA